MNQYIYNKVLDHDGEIEHNSGKFLKHDRIGRSSSSSSPIGNMVFGCLLIFFTVIFLWFNERRYLF